MKSRQLSLSNRLAGVFVALMPCFAAAAIAAEPAGGATETARVLDAAGGVSTNAQLGNTSAVGQGLPVGMNRNLAVVNYSGFLNAYGARPDLDHDGDGVADENDLDDDNDGLEDRTELAGTAFDPNTPTEVFTADSDADGAGDGKEAGAGTNPFDPGSLLKITDVEIKGSEVVVTWISRGGYLYEILSGASIEALGAPVVLDTVTAEGGVAPWFETVSRSTNSAAGEREFIRIRRVE